MGNETLGAIRLGFSTAPLKRKIVAVRNRGLAITVVAAIASLLIARKVSLSITQPVQQLVVGTQNLARGNFDEPMQINTGDELAVLGTAFNEMGQQLKHTLRLLKANHQRPAVIINKNYGDLPIVKCYPGSLDQVFMNLLSNALDAMDEAGKHLTYEELEGAPHQLTINTYLGSETSISVDISDNGIGIPEELSSELLNPFFTTKPIGKGTSLGLSIS